MATSQLCFCSSLITVPFSSSSSTPRRPQERQTVFFTGLTSNNSLPKLSNPCSRRKWVRAQAQGGDPLGDFGARDPFPAEIASGFAERVLGNVDTEHKILIPSISALSLAQQECCPISPLQPPMSEEDAQKLLRKVVGWRLIEEERSLKLQCLWKLRDFKCGVELINRIYKAVEATGHYPNLHLEQANQIRAELQTALIGGLSMNDFIVAAKIDEIKTSDLVPKKRIWA
ncbi:probable pterin-4-alpha-carbinolamine dehydratase, chloroplastic [Macadamia integrifolia]|uniref:probable pterin-4-alpha-carbinolamine dehydratase, chloroplastic n=1 Tax=Macadamia integrifolia TaxID=60698 RepID=UPI001C4F046D|nr:probable pterin-4-alpha-carbinolamine dehydratase, chloroplastic [Macadamia integrifolia]